MQFCPCGHTSAYMIADKRNLTTLFLQSCENSTFCPQYGGIRFLPVFVICSFFQKGVKRFLIWHNLYFLPHTRCHTTSFFCHTGTRERKECASAGKHQKGEPKWAIPITNWIFLRHTRPWTISRYRLSWRALFHFQPKEIVGGICIGNYLHRTAKKFSNELEYYEKSCKRKDAESSPILRLHSLEPQSRFNFPGPFFW